MPLLPEKINFTLQDVTNFSKWRDIDKKHIMLYIKCHIVFI